MITTCSNPLHDHTDEDGAPTTMLCEHCGAPCHYDYAVEDYRHDDAGVTCFLIVVPSTTTCGEKG